MAVWLPMGIFGGGLAQCLDITSTGKIHIGSDTQGYYFDDSATYGDNVRSRNTGLGASANYNQIACILASTQHAGTTYIGTGDGLLQTTDDGLHWTPVNTSAVIWAANGADSADPIPSLQQQRPVGRLLMEDSAGGTQFLWAATYKTGIKRSTDQGVTWPVVANMGGAAPGTNYFARCIAQDPDQTTTCYAGFIDHSSGTTGFGGLWKCANAHSTSPAPNFIKQAGLAVPAVEDIVVRDGLIYAACGPDGVFMADKTADLSNSANWINIGTVGGSGTGPVLNAASIWMSIDLYNDGSGHHQILAACSRPGDASNTAVVKITVTIATKTVTARAALATTASSQMATIPPGGQTWWNANPGFGLGGGNFQNPQVRWDFNDGTHQKIYMTADEGLYRSVNGGTNWTIACQGMRMFLGRALATDPNRAGWGAVASSDWGVVFWNDGVAASATTTAQSPSGVPNSVQVYAIAVDPVDSTVYLGLGSKYERSPQNGQVMQGAGGATFPPGPFTNVGGTPTWATATGSKSPTGLIALRDGSNNKVLLAASGQGGGLWRNVQASGSWTGWTQVGAATAAGTSTLIPAGNNVRFDTGPGVAGQPPVIYCYDPRTGIFRSLDYGVTWATVTTSITSGAANSAELTAHPFNVGEVWVTANKTMRKLTNAHGTGVFGNTLITTLTNPGAIRFRPTDALLAAVTTDSGSGQATWKSTDRGATWTALGGSEFGQLDNTTEHIRFDQGGVSGRMYASGSNIVETILLSTSSGGAFTAVQQSNNLVGSAGTFNAWFSATSVGSTVNNLLSVRLSMNDCAMTVTPPNANWELVSDSPSGTTTSQARTQIWEYRRCTAGIGASVGTAAVFTYSNASADVRGRLNEHSSASPFQYIDRTGINSALASSAAPGPVTGGAAARATGGLALTVTSAWHSNTPTGQSWGAVTGWTNDGAAANQPNAFHLMEQAVPAGTETFTDAITLGTGTMASWAQSLVTLWCSAVQVTTASLPAGNQGAAYSQSLAASGGTGPYTWSLWSGALPPGMAISGTSIAGTATAAGTFTFRVLATDSTGAMGYSALLSITVAPGVSITTMSPLPDGAVGDAYSQSLSLAGGTAPYTWTRPSGTLPTGLSLSSAGVITGTPSSAGPFTFDVQVTDTNGSTDRTTLAITIQQAVTVTTVTLDNATAGESYAFALAEDGGLPAFAWAVTSGALPSGIALDAPTGLLAGTPDTPGTYPFNVTVTDGGGSTSTRGLVLVVLAPPAPGAAVDSLVVAGQFELCGGGVVSDHPACPGAIFRLGKAGGDLDYDLGMPQPTTDLIASLALDGERPFGRRASNRAMVVPVVIQVPPSGDLVADRTLLASAREAFLQAVDGDRWELTWARAGGQPMIFDCFRAGATTYHYSLLRDRSLISVMDVTFQALPYGRSDVLETLAFAAPSANWQVPADPVTIDDFSSVSSSTDSGQWSRSTQSADGSFSAHWSRRWRDRPHYTHTVSAPVTIGSRPKVSLWVGLGTSPDQFHVWHGGKVTADVKLTDSSGTTIQMAATVRCACSGLPNQPAWTRISMPMPVTTDFDTTAVASYSVKLWNTTDSGTGNRVLQAECYIGHLEASSAAVGAPAQRGAVYQLRGVIGSARAPLNVQVQPGPASLQQQVTLSNAGTLTWNPPAGTLNAKLEATGAGGGGGGGTPASGTQSPMGGGGGGGGEYAAEPSWPLAPGQAVVLTTGAAGTGGPANTVGTDGADSFITVGGTEVVRAHGGTRGHRGGTIVTTGAAGGAGSASTMHFDGGDGGPPQSASGVPRFEGSGGGSSGGTFQAGNDGARAKRIGNTSNFAGGLGGAGVAGGGPGGNGGNEGPGNPPSNGPGGGGGGGDGHANAPGGNGWAGRCRITYGVTAGVPIKSLILHRASPDAPGTLQPLVSVFGTGTDVPDGSIEYPVTSYARGVQPKFAGTYTVVAVAQSWHGSAGTARTLTVGVKQYDGASGSPPGVGVGRTTVGSAGRTFTPNDAPNGVVVLGNITLPLRGMAPDQADATYTVTITSTDTADLFYDVLFLDVEGSTMLLNGTVQGYANVFVDAPEPDQGMGQVLGSYYDRDAASSVLDDTLMSGPPLSVEPGDNWLLAYCPTGVPAMFATYLPRWWLDRLR